MRLGDLSDPKLKQVIEIAASEGVDIAPVTFERETRTSVDAAREIGCSVAEIAKSLVFAVEGTGETVLLLLSGADRVDLTRAAETLGVPALQRADPDTAKKVTGYSIGATPPFGHRRSMRVIMDDGLLGMDHVWAAGGRTDAVFRISSQDLRRISGASVARLRADAP